MGRTKYLRGITIALAAMHLLPARHHLADFFASPSMSDAWKGFGALVAITLLALPQRFQARLAALVWKYRAIGVVIAAAHVVPALDHLPKLVASFTFGDAWKGLGATIAVLWFLAPRAVQLAVVRAPKAPLKLALAAGVTAMLLAACAQNGLIRTATETPTRRAPARAKRASSTATARAETCARSSVATRTARRRARRRAIARATSSAWRCRR